MQQDEDMLLQSIYEEYQGTLRRIARALNVPNMELEDVVQETFIAYFRKYSLTWSPTLKKAMLVKILKGKAIDCLRKNGHYEKVSLDEENSIRCIEMLTTYVVTDPIDIIISEESDTEDYYGNCQYEAGMERDGCFVFSRAENHSGDL